MKYLREYTEKETSRALKENGAFFAFDISTFKEKKKEGVKYVDMGGGLLCPKENADKLFNQLEEVHKQGIFKDMEENGAEKIIEREFFNYETQISYDDSDFRDEMKQYQKHFPDIFTNDFINKIANRCYRKAYENGWY